METTNARADCGATDDLRYARLLTAPDVWLCLDAAACRRRRAHTLAGV